MCLSYVVPKLRTHGKYGSLALLDFSSFQQKETDMLENRDGVQDDKSNLPI